MQPHPLFAQVLAIADIPPQLASRIQLASNIRNAEMNSYLPVALAIACCLRFHGKNTVYLCYCTYMRLACKDIEMAYGWGTCLQRARASA